MISESQFEKLIVVLDHIRQSRKAAVMIEAALLMAPQTGEGRSPVHVRRGSVGLPRIYPDLARSVEIVSRFREKWRDAQMSVQKGIRVNVTLCFSQEQAAAVYAATKGSKEPVYVSPFVGRLDDRGEDGMDLVRNIKRIYEHSDGHVQVLAASIRSVNQLLCCFALSVELATVPTKVLGEWAATGFPMPDRDFRYRGVDASGKALRAIPYRELDLSLSWESFDIAHELTRKGIEKFVLDYRSTLRRSV